MAISNAQERINELERKKANASASRPVVNKPGQVYDPGSGPRPTQTVSSNGGQTVSMPSQKRGPRNGRAGTSPLLTDSQARSAYSSMQRKNASNAMSVGILTGQDMSAYRGNLSTPVNTDKPTYRDAMAGVYALNQTDPSAASHVYSELENARFDPSSPYYNPFAGVTNRAAQAMQNLGYDVSNIDDAWFERYSYLRQYYVPTANTNGLSTTMTNKRSTPEQQAAYYYNQLYMARDDTKKAQQETDALEQELKFWAGNRALNLSDDEIIARIDWSKYPTLSKMDSTRMAGTPMELNAPMRYSEDWMYSTLWAARNNGGTGNATSDMINSVLGVGNVWHNDQEIHDKLDPGNREKYSPYSVSSTMYDECCYFGVPSFSRDWVDRNYSRIMNSGDKTAIKMFGNVVDAVEYTETLDTELAAMDAEIDKMLKYVSDPDIVLKRIQENSDFKDLFALDDTLTHPSKALKKTAWAVDYRWVDVEARVRKVCAENEEKRNAADIVEDAQNIDVPYWDTKTGGFVDPNEVDAVSGADAPATKVNKTTDSGNAAGTEDEVRPTATPQKLETENDAPTSVLPTAVPSKEAPAPTNETEAAPGERKSSEEKAPAYSAENIGQFGAGNIDLFNREAVIDKDGNVETVRSISFYDDQSNKEVLIPTIIDGKEVSDNEAIDHYYETGEFLGKFDSVDEANAYAEQLHLQQEQLYTDSVNSVAKEDLIAPEKPAAEETATPAPVVSDSEKEIMQQEKANLDEVAPVVMEYGTPAEKVAVQTVHSMDYHYNQHMKTFRDMYPDAGDKWLMSAATKNLVGDYFSQYNVIWNYNRVQAEKDTAEAELAGTEERWKELNTRSAPMEPLELSWNQYLALEELVTGDDDETWNAMKVLLNNGGDPQDVALAQEELYYHVSGDTNIWQYDDEKQRECREMAQLWWDYYTADANPSPVDILVRKANIRNTGIDGEVEDTLVTPDGVKFRIRLLPNENGELEFAGAFDKNGERYSADEVDDMMGFDQADALSYEEEMELAAIEERREALKAKIEESDAYLADEKNLFTQAMSDKEQLERSYAMGAMLYGQDTGLLEVMDEFYSIGMDASPFYSIGDIMEYYISSGEISEEEASFYERKSSISRGNQADRLEKLLTTMDRMGVQVPEEMRQNVQKRIDVLRADSEASSYALLENNGDFDRVVNETKSKAEAGEYGDFARRVAERSGREGESTSTGNEALDFMLSDAVTLFNLGTTLNTRTRDTAINADMLNAMREKEVKRYLYVLGTEGQEAADKYWNMLADEDHGFLLARRSANLSDTISGYASKGIMQATVASAVSLGTKFVSGPIAGFNQVKTYLQGKSINPNNPAYDWQNITNSARAGSSEALTNLVGGKDTTFGKITSFLYNSGMGIADFMLKRKFIGEAFGALGIGTRASNVRTVASNTTATDLSTKIVESASATATIEGLDVPVEATISAAAGVDAVKVASKGLNVAIAASIAQDSASKAWWDAVYYNDATPDEALAYSGITFVGETLAYSFMVGNMNKVLTGGREGGTALASFVRDLYVGGTEHALSAGTVTAIEQEANKWILKEKSNYEARKAQIFEQYKGKYPEAIAKKMAEDQASQEAWRNIVVNAGQGALLSTLFTAGVYAYKYAPRISFDFRRGGKSSATGEGTGSSGNISDREVPRIGENTQEWDVPSDEQIEFVVNRGDAETGSEPMGLITAGESAPSGEVAPGTGGSPIVPDMGNDSGAPNLPSQASIDEAQAVTSRNANQFARDQAMLASGMTNTSPAGEAFTIDGVLGNSNLAPDPNATRAAAQNLVGGEEFANGRTKTATKIMSIIELVVPEQNLDMIKWDITHAAVVSGSEGANALSSIFYKVGQGEMITPDDVYAVSKGVANDRANDPEYMQKYADGIRNNRIALEMANIFMSGSMSGAIHSAEESVKQASENARRAEKALENAEADMKSAEKALNDATNNHLENPLDPSLNAPVEQATNKIEAADRNLILQQDAVKDAQENLESAKVEKRRTEEKELNKAREEATAVVDQKIADEQAALAEANAAAEQENAEAQALSAEQAERAASTRATQENYVRSILAESNITGEQAETIVQRAMSRADEVARGGVDMNAPINAAEGQQFLNYLSNTMGFQIEMKDLGNPRVVRGMNIGGDRLVLNSQLSKGQALVEATFHEMIHGLESTPAYKPFSDVVTNILFKGENTPAFREAIRKKKLYYSAVGAPLATDDDAKREIVADFGRTHLASKKFLRKIVNAGAGNEVKKYVRKAWTNLKGYKLDAEGTAERRKLQKAERLLQQMLAELAQMRKEGYKGHTGITQFSINSAAQMAGLKVEVTDDDNYLYKLYDGDKLIEPGKFTPEMVKNTPAGRLIDFGIQRREKMLLQRMSDGVIRKAEYDTKLEELNAKADKERKFISDIINMIGKYQDAAMVWELSGSLAFSVLKTNGDPQYFDSEDMGSICTKTQAILNVMSDTQLKLGRALTKAEIDGIVYEEVGRGVLGEDGKWQHGATPCPPCYVFATWVNKPARLEMVRQFQIETADWTDEDINNFMNLPSPEPIPGKMSKGRADKLKAAQNAKKLWIKLCLADEHKTKDTTTYTRRANPDICPNEILLDLRRSGDMATKHPGVWTFMQKGGNAVGKAISEYADSRLGETIVGKAIGAGKLNEMLMADARNASNPDYVPQFINPFLIMDDENAEKKAQEYFDRAVEKVKAQNLKNGQRWQSWSDFRAEWGSDYLMEMLVMDALGAKVQTYTKVHEALDLLASAGFEVNMSLMPHGDGFWHNEDGSIAVDEDGNLKLRFSGVTGINPEAAEEFARKYGEKGNVQPMVVGISDQHIMAALAGDYIMFVIPFHGSGGSVKRLQHLMKLLKENMQAGFDYTKAQSDKFEEFVRVDRQEGDDTPVDDEDEDSGKKVNTNPNWRLREAIITGQYESLSDSDKDAIDNNEFLRKLYEDRYVNKDSEAFGVFFSRSQAQQIYPYEYWDTNTTLATADENSKRFCDYCQMLGVIPRFSGLVRKAGKNKYFKESEYGIADKLHPESIVRDDKGRVIQFEYANFSGRKVDDNGNVTYNPVKGYWKLLIDRNMYNRVYGDDGKLIKDKCTYHEQQPVDVTNINVGAMPMAANNTVGHSDDQSRAIAERVIQRIEMTSGQNKAAGSAVDMNENKKIIQDAMYGDSGVKLSAGGELSVNDLDILLAEADRKYMAAVEAGDMNTAQEMVYNKADEQVKDFLLPDDSDEAGFKYHRGPAPTKTFKRYAVLNVSPDGFRAAYAGNKNPTPLGVWLDAQNLQSYTSDITQLDDGSFATYIPGDTGFDVNDKFTKEQQKALNLPRGKRWLLERGGKHSSDVPNFSQMNTSKNENGETVKNLKKDGALPHNKLIFEIEYGTSDDGDLTEYVKEHGRKIAGKNQGLAKIHPNQFYDFKTNPNAVGNWGLGGTFRIIRLVPHDEIVSVTEEYKENAIADAKAKYDAGEISKADRDKRIKGANAIQIQKWVGGYHPEDFGLSVEGVDEMVKRGKQMKLTDAVTYDDEGNVIPLSERFNQNKQDIRYSAGGDFTDADIDTLLNDADALVEEQSKYPSSIVKLNPNQSDEQRETVIDYLKSTDSRVLEAAKVLQSDKSAWIKPIELEPVSDREAKDILKITGEDCTGYTHMIDRNAFNHIQKRHGEKGNHDHSMADLNDVSRIGWVIKHYDKIEEDDDKDERIAIGYRKGNNESMISIAYTKKIDGTIYVVEAVGENKSKQLHVLTAYMEKNKPAPEVPGYAASRAADVTSPSLNVLDEHGSPAEIRIAQQESDVNSQKSIGGDLTDAEIDQLLVDSGIISPEMIPYSYLPGNRTGGGHGPYRQFGRYRAQESNALHDQVKEYLYNNSEYTRDHNGEQIDRAIAWVQTYADDNDPTGYYGALREVESPNFDYRSADGQARMLTVLSMAALRAEAGDPGAMADERRIAQAFNKQGTNLGQALQARKIFRLMTPLGRMSVLEGMVDELNDELARKGKRANTRSGRVELDDDLLQRAGRARNPKDFDEVRRETIRKIAKQLPPDWKDKLRAWRYMAMLLNPRTHMRNVLGNLLFVPTVGIKNKIGAMMELTQEKGNRTKTLRLFIPKEIKDFASQDAIDHKDVLTGVAKYDDRTQIDREKRIFNSFLQHVYNFSGNSLEWEDWQFLKGHYRRALGGWIVANGYTVEQLKNDPILLEQGRQYAIQEAQKATYRDFNETAEKLAAFARNPESDAQKAVAFLVNAAVPFKRTPANILSRALEYSLLGLTRSLTTDLYHLKQYLDWEKAHPLADDNGGGGNGDVPPNPPAGSDNPPADNTPPPDGAITPNEWIDRFASGLTGTGIMIAGALLASLGYITAGFDKDEKDMENAKGNQEYSVKILGHDVTYTLDWAAPMSMPFFVGATIQKMMADDEGWDWESVINALSSIADPITNMSMLEGINNVLTTNSNGDNSISQIVGNVLANYTTSYVPSFVGAIARIVDPVSRKAFVESGKTGGLVGPFRYALEQIENKLPGLSQTNIPARDVWGNAIEKPQWERAIENILSPGYWKEYNGDDPVISELSRLYDMMPDESYLIPKDPSKSIGKIALHGKQWDDYKVVRNGTAYLELSKLFSSEYYDDLDPKEQAGLVKKTWEYCTVLGKQAVFPSTKMDKWMTMKDPVATLLHTEGMLKAIETNDFDGYQTMVYALRDAGMSDVDIKDKISDRYRDKYKAAYQSGDLKTMLQIESALSITGFKFDIHGKGGWEGQVDKKLAEEQNN